jgi:hypothetical protein
MRRFPLGPSFFIYFSFPSHATPPGGEYITRVVDALSMIAKSMAALGERKLISKNTKEIKTCH